MESEILIIDKNFGVITENEVVLSKKNNQKNINFNIIKKVKLIKQRIYLTNLLLIILSVNLFIVGYKLLSYNHILSFGLISIGIYCLIMSIYHKYYKYKLVIIENGNAIHKIETKQSNRDSIKDFYYTIANKISKKKSDLN